MQIVVCQRNIANEMVVSGHLSEWGSGEFILGFIEELPDHDGFITRAGDQHAGFFIFLNGVTGDDAGYPIAVALEETDVVEL